jgi:hypothetical protein
MQLPLENVHCVIPESHEALLETALRLQLEYLTGPTDQPQSQ